MFTTQLVDRELERSCREKARHDVRRFFSYLGELLIAFLGGAGIGVLLFLGAWGAWTGVALARDLLSGGSGAWIGGALLIALGGSLGARWGHRLITRRRARTTMLDRLERL